MRLNDGRVIPAFMGQALRREDLTVFGKGTQTRSFCYVDDLVNGIYKLLFSDYHYPVNLGNPEEFTILELAHLVISMTKSSSKIILMPLPSDDPLQRRPDIALAKEYLDNWHPNVSLENGLIKTIDYFDSLLLQQS